MLNNENNQFKLLTAVVTFNRKQLLIENIRSQLKQTYPITYLLIIDNNSNDGTYEALVDEKIIGLSNVYYYNTGDNLGGAGGFEFAVRKAVEYDCDLICLMDDDGKPLYSNTFENLIRFVPDNITEPLFLNCLVVNDKEELSFGLGNECKTIIDAKQISKNGLVHALCNPFNGTFINKALVNKIGYPRGDFFIRFDEVDYFKRSLKSNAFVGTVVDSLYYHPSTSSMIAKKLFGKTFINEYESPWKEYYKMRNSLILARENGTSRIRCFLKYKKYLFGMLLFKINDRKLLKRFIKRGYKDAMIKKTGKIINPGQLEI